jgi:hypothetical protein
MCFRLEPVAVCCDACVQHVTVLWGQNAVLRVEPAGAQAYIND